MLVDSHCHLDAAEFDADRAIVMQAALAAGVQGLIIPAVSAAHFSTVITLANQHRGYAYALGWHPMYMHEAGEDAIAVLDAHIQRVQTQENANKLIAVGEIGLDFFVTRENEAKQIALFVAQLKLAQQYDLPVILHVRGAIDTVLKYLRLYPVRGGIAHAFNGSLQQAQAFIDLGFKLGFGGAMTYPRALKIRALAEKLDMSHIVLETDAPDIPPAWLGHRGRNTPDQLIKIAQELALLKRIPVSQIIEITGKNIQQIFPFFADLFTPLKVVH